MLRRKLRAGPAAGAAELRARSRALELLVDTIPTAHYGKSVR
jgi:hypothetical protein